MHANKYEDNIHCADLEQILFIIPGAQPTRDLMEGGAKGIYFFVVGNSLENFHSFHIFVFGGI